MHKMPIHKYQPYPTVNLSDRQWPSKSITQAPIWCSVDLRDGNQALVDPMTLDEKIELFELLTKIGFKQIEIGFPSASQVEFDFCRRLIEENLIPEDVTIQVLVQARQNLIERSFESLKGARRAIVHVYNSTSELQRRVVFRKDKDAIKALAVEGAQLLQDSRALLPDTDLQFEYSPESFTGTEIDYALEVCEAVLDVWKPTAENKAILNLPATVEMSSPNIYADRIEWFHRNLKHRDSVLISLHTHNDRGTGVAASELGLMAGGDRVEGTLFGNGERTGNCDLVVMALNLFSQGVDPCLDLSRINHIRDVSVQVTKLPIHPRHPYVGELVYTAFSGSHQDAIAKGMHAYDPKKQAIWEVPYLPIDPKDVGRTYQSIIRINSQSGKGGVAYILEQEYGLKLPKGMHPEFGAVVQTVTDTEGTEIPGELIWKAFEQTYLAPMEPIGFHTLVEAVTHEDGSEVSAVITLHGERHEIVGSGRGLLEAFAHGLGEVVDYPFTFISYDQHAVAGGVSSQAAAYICIERPDGLRFYGAGLDANISLAAMKALVSSLNRAYS